MIKTVTVVDVLTALGVLLNLTKGAELLLRPHQERWLKDRIETITLWLSYLRPLNYYKRIVSPGVILALVLAFGLTMYPVFHPFLLRLWVITEHTDPVVYFSGLILMFITFASYRKLNTPLFYLVSGKYNKDHGLPFGLRDLTAAYAKVCLTLGCFSCMFIGLQYLALSLYVHRAVRRDASILGSTLVAQFALLYDIAAYSFVVGIILVATLTFVLAQGVILALRGLAWRITEFNKGPVAAVSIVVTVLCGLLDAYLRTQLPKK
jgi:hypothetical protein